MKKLLALLLAAALLCGVVPTALADGGQGYLVTDSGGYAVDHLLTNFGHNCPSTGVLLPAQFNPNVTSYLLSVAHTVARIRITPYYPLGATCTVNGQYVASGQESQNITLGNDAISIPVVVTGSSGISTTYTIFVQRRPSNYRTRVSAGYINRIYKSNSAYYIDADLFTVTYSTGNMSTFVDKGVDSYKYQIADSCIFYYGTIWNPIRATDINDFMNHYLGSGSNMYRIIYIESKIVAVMPYAPDYY